MDNGTDGMGHDRPHRLTPVQRQRPGAEPRNSGKGGSESRASKTAADKERSVVLVLIALGVVCVPLTLGLIVDAPVAVLTSLATGVGATLTAIATVWVSQCSKP
jgi:hypothetical protein